MPAALACWVACISAPPYSLPAASCRRPELQDGGSPRRLLRPHLGAVNQRIRWINDNRIGGLEAGQHLYRISIVAPDLGGNQRNAVVLYNTAPQSLRAEQKRVGRDRDGTDLFR